MVLTLYYSPPPPNRGFVQYDAEKAVRQSLITQRTQGTLRSESIYIWIPSMVDYFMYWRVK